MALRIARAFGIKLTEIECNEEVKRFMWRTLVRTRKLGEGSFQVVAKGVDGKSTLLFTSPLATVASLIESYKVEAFFDESTSLRALMNGKEISELATMASIGASKDCTFHLLPRVVLGGMRDVSDPPSPLLAPAKPPPANPLSPLPSPAPRVATLSSEPSLSGALNRAHASSSKCDELSPSVLRQVPPSKQSSPSFDPPPSRPREAMRTVPPVAVPTPGRQGSPQPTSAAAARARSTLDITDVLTSIDTEYAICPSDPEKLKAMVGEMGKALVVGIPKGTKAADEWGFKKVVQFCIHMGPTVRWMRPRLDSPLVVEVNEVYFTSLAMFWTAQCNMDASARRAAAFGATKAQPPSALLAIYGWRRVQRDCGRHLCLMVEVKKVLHGMCLQYKRAHGKTAFEKQQAPLMCNEQLARIELACADSGPHTLTKWPPVQRKMWRFLNNYLVCTGTRNDEVTEDAANEFDCIKRENFFPVDVNGNEIPATPSAIAGMKNGDLLGAMSGASKRDRLNVHWSMQKQYFEYSDTEANNLPHAWQQYELAAPCPMDKRASWPAFSIRGGPMPMTTSQSASQHRTLILHALPELADVVNKPTIHSYRAILASKLAEARAQGDNTITDATIQAHVRWKTLASLLSYTKITPVRFANNITKALRVDAGKTARHDIPEIEPGRTLQDIEAALGCIDTDTSAEDDELQAAAPTSSAASKSKGKQPIAPSKAAPTVAPKAPRGNGKAKATPTPAAETVAIVGRKEPVAKAGSDPWGLLGSTISLPHEIWEELDGGHAVCTIDHFLGLFKFAKGGSHVAYSVSIHGFEGNYAVRADVVSRHLSPEQRLRLRSNDTVPHAVKISARN
jgi:hypothetical protein